MLYHVIYDWFLGWQEMWLKGVQEPPDEWVIAEVVHVFDEVEWDNDEDQFRSHNRII